MSTTPRVACALAIGVLLAAISTACREDNLVEPDRNREPETFITGAPREQSDAGVRVHFYWRGHDPDGAVLSYQVAVDDTSFTAWTTTERTDSIFLFRVEPTESRVPHTFYVVAIDDDGKRDSSPASRTFTAVDQAAPLVDEAWITYGLPGDVPVQLSVGDTVPSRPPGAEPYTVRMHWTGEDADGEIVEYLYRVGNGPEISLPYQDTVVVDLGPLPPKPATDGDPYFVRIFAVDDAGLRGGAGAAGVEEARLNVVVDKTPSTVIDSVVVNGTVSGSDYNLGTRTYFTVPPDTVTFTGAELASGAVTFLASAKLDIHFSSSDPEDGCVQDEYWVSTEGVFASGLTRSPYQVGTCDGGVTHGVLVTGNLVGATPSTSSRNLWVRGRDAHLREESPGPKTTFRVNVVPTCTIDSLGVAPGTNNVTVLGHGTDADTPSSDIRFESYLDGRRIPVTAFPHVIPGTSYVPGPSGTPHEFILRASNQTDFIRASADTVQFNTP